MELTAEQILLVGMVGSVIAQALRLLAEHKGYIASREVVTVVLFVVSVGLSISFFGLPEVSNGDPMELAGKLLAGASGVFGSAVALYHLLLNKVLRPVGNSK